MARAVAITVPVGAGVGGLVGLAFAPWWTWAPVGVAAGAVYAAVLTVLGVRLMAWLRRGSPERQAGVTVGGALGALAAAFVGALGTVVHFLPPGTDNAEVFAVGVIGLFAAGPIGFLVGGPAGGLLTTLYEWLDTKYVTPLRAESAVVERATKTGAAVGAVVAMALVLGFGFCQRNRGGLEPPDWLVATLLALMLLGLFWAIRIAAKRNREDAPNEAMRLMAPEMKMVVLIEAVGFAGGAVGFLVGVVLHRFGWQSVPVEEPVRKEKRKARPGWWRKRPRE